ncbi:MAG: NTP transferase domain-containing protein [Bacteroidia bacterium]|nr:NTP transferase domain-containing protein [Bacteroidia bacterium]
MNTTVASIMAAGKGTRMGSTLPKPLIPLKGKPILQYIIEAFQKAGIEEIIVIVGHKRNEIKKAIGDQVHYIVQNEQKGTAHAVQQAKGFTNWGNKDLFVFVGDCPLITSETIQSLFDHHKETNADCTFLTAEFPDTPPYARIVRDQTRKLIKCVEEKNASEDERKIKEVMTSHLIFKGGPLFKYLDQVPPDDETGEYYIIDVINIFLDKGLKVQTLNSTKYHELIGLNTPQELAWAEDLLEVNS